MVGAPSFFIASVFSDTRRPSTFLKLLLRPQYFSTFFDLRNRPIREIASILYSTLLDLPAPSPEVPRYVRRSQALLVRFDIPRTFLGIPQSRHPFSATSPHLSDPVLDLL
jgi:hypothetical protein